MKEKIHFLNVLVSIKWDNVTLDPPGDSYVSHTRGTARSHPGHASFLVQGLVSLDFIRYRANRVSQTPPADPWV